MKKEADIPMNKHETEILVIDGQGGSLGAMLCKLLTSALPKARIVAVGTNSIASAAMLKAGAHTASTGEYPVVCAAPWADYIVAPLGAAVPSSLGGEVTPAMAEAVGRSRAHKFLIPGDSDRCRLHVVGAATPMALSKSAARAVEMICEMEKNAG